MRKQDKIVAAILGVVLALATIGLGFTLSEAWRSISRPEHLEIALNIPAVQAPQPATSKTNPPPPIMAAATAPADSVPRPVSAPAEPRAPRVKSTAPREDAAINPADPPAIAIVIDDLGGDKTSTRRSIGLAKEVTLAFLPYPEHTPDLSREAFGAGHEVILHMPMEPKSRKSLAPNVLLLDMPREEIRRRVEWGLSRVPDRIGLNNHEGSWFTSDHKALYPVMEVLAKENIFFLDSRTSAHSKGVSIARRHHVRSAGRDIFLDNIVDSKAIARQLGEVERHARKHGLVIAIGHPHRQTLAALEAWIPEVQKLGYHLIPLSQAIARRNPQTTETVRD